MISAEAAVLHAVIENREDEAADQIKERFFNNELIEFTESVGRLLDLLNADIRRRGLT